MAGRYLDAYLEKIRADGSSGFADSIQHTADEVGKKYLETFSFASHEAGLLFGNVQSGKTGQMLGILCKAADLGFPVFLVLTIDNVVLQRQTLERVQADLDGFCICGENDSQLFIDNMLIKPTIVVLKKNAQMLRLWANVFSSTGFMKGNPLFVIDDEADAASLNTLVNQNRQSSVNKYLDSMKTSAFSSMYLQVTGTPQALLLQTQLSGWRPYFTYYFSPGTGYLGGDFFFPKDSSKDPASCITFLKDIKEAERSVVIRHLTVSAQILGTGGKVSCCLVHPSVRQAVHQRFADKIQQEIQWCRDHREDFRAVAAEEYKSLAPRKSRLLTETQILDKAEEILDSNALKVLILNGKTDVQTSDYSNGCCFVVGGNTLGRGVTFPSLQTIYYTRTSKLPQADTMWQHSRMFGYDRDPGLMKVYIDEPLYKLFADINAVNHSLVAQIEKGADDIKIYYPKNIQPTRKQVLDQRHIGVIPGGVNFYPLDPDNDQPEELDSLLARFADTEPYYQVSLRLIQTVLGHIIPSPDFRLEAFQTVLDAMLSDDPMAQGVMIVRRGRDVSQGTGALLSPNDWQLGVRFSSRTVLTLYQVAGAKGWKRHGLWVPNLKFPEGMVYYNIV